MNPLNFADIWTYIGPLIGAVLGFVGSYFLERRKELREKRNILQVVECAELFNAKVLDTKSLGSIAHDLQIKAPSGGPKSEIIDIHEIYFAQYRFRNLSDTPIGKLLVNLKNEPNAVWFSITEGEDSSNPDWEKQLEKLLEEEKISEERGWAGNPIPYLNPYQGTKHEVLLELSSYLPLDKVEIAGGAHGIKFVFKKSGKAS